MEAQRDLLTALKAPHPATERLSSTDNVQTYALYLQRAPICCNGSALMDAGRRANFARPSAVIRALPRPIRDWL